MERVRQRDWFNPAKGHEGKLLAKLRGESVEDGSVGGQGFNLDEEQQEH